MFCISFKSMRLRLMMLVVGIVLVVAVIFIVQGSARTLSVRSSPFPSGATQQERLLFLSEYGWNVLDDPINVEDVFIPAQFGEVYSNYNAIQLSQGFDLLPYAGRSVKKWVYAVTNYPGYSQSDVFVRATLLICQGRIIGGDICSVELDGFMHGFAYETGY